MKIGDKIIILVNNANSARCKKGDIGEIVSFTNEELFKIKILTYKIGSSDEKFFQNTLWHFHTRLEGKQYVPYFGDEYKEVIDLLFNR